MKKCLLLFVFVPLFTFSQSKINYYYDASGISQKEKVSYTIEFNLSNRIKY